MGDALDAGVGGSAASRPSGTTNRHCRPAYTLVIETELQMTNQDVRNLKHGEAIPQQVLLAAKTQPMEREVKRRKGKEAWCTVRTPRTWGPVGRRPCHEAEHSRTKREKINKNMRCLLVLNGEIDRSREKRKVDKCD